ncbi:hypothetical protein [Falsiroseomonas tokyonensis]|uniref:Uncharacterized protein n=1 Tax=Falsiroseomonas tokyonensis TaxID=430521 RepID=A0ABV7BZS3_9PROT|nr:hypothetical protein [Falsiroseomonas tokyonensis]MBU8540160.1 hypothetical protein [Falsiroseomonas tokyonensis]
MRRRRADALTAAGDAGIPVINTPDYGTTEVADHAVTLALTLLRGVKACDRRLRRSNDSGLRAS